MVSSVVSANFSMSFVKTETFFFLEEDFERLNIGEVFDRILSSNRLLDSTHETT